MTTNEIPKTSFMFKVKLAGLIVFLLASAVLFALIESYGIRLAIIITFPIIVLSALSIADKKLN